MHKKLDLTQLLTMGGVLATLALAVPSYVATSSQAEIGAQAQLTDRFSRAIDQLGATDNLEVRLGGIYALERIARDSPRDHPTVMNVLSTFVSEKGKNLRNPEGYCPSGIATRDVRAAMTVLIHPEPGSDRGRSDLSGACLGAADLTGANLAYTKLVGADLSGAHLTGADLTGTNFLSSDVRGADLRGAKLIGADLSNADLRYAILINADLTGADIEFADFTNSLRVPEDLKRPR